MALFRWESSSVLIGVLLDRQVGDGGAQRLLRCGRDIGAAAEVELGESCEAAQCTQLLARHAVAASEIC
jgi:hypothetical protein